MRLLLVNVFYYMVSLCNVRNGITACPRVILFLERKMDKASRNGNLKDIKISFVGHSIGNLIIRIALTVRTIFNSGLWI
ncbi:hypothetical protein AAZV13_14G134900 [Glycine max]